MDGSKLFHMKKRWPLWIMGLLLTQVPSIRAQDKLPLKLIQKIPLPNVKGRIDHMDVDVRGKRLFVAGLENGTLEVVDLKAGKWARSVPGLKAPQATAYGKNFSRSSCCAPILYSCYKREGVCWQP
jgi:hypothetical protein